MTAPLVVVLAGGEGRRIGGGKPLRTLGNERLVDRALRLARRWSDDVRVAVRSPGQLGELKAPLLIDDPGIGGPLGGLASALDAAREAGRSLVLTLPCDTPFLPDDLAALLEAAVGHRMAAIAASGTELHPACALWRVAALDRLPGYLATGRLSLTGFAEAIGYARAEVAADALLNVNDAAGLALAERRLWSEIEHFDERPRSDGSAAGP